MKIFLLIIINSLICFDTYAAVTNIQIDTNINYQIITGWEATSYIASECDGNFAKIRDLMLPLIVDSIGITRIRLEVRSGVENSHDYYADYIAAGCPVSPDTNYAVWRAHRYATVNDNEDTTINWNGFHFTDFDWKIENIVLPLKNLLEKKGEKLFINVNNTAFTGQIKDGTYIHNDPNEYAEFVLATYLHMKARYGFVPDAWELILEPDNVKHWNGTLLGQAIVKSAERLKQYGFRPNFIGPSCTNMSNAVKYFDDMILVPGAINYLTELSYHRYGGVSQASLKAIADRARTYGINTSMLEWWFDNSTYKVLHEDLSVGNNSAFQQAVVSGFFNIDNSDPKNPRASIKDISQYNRLYYLFVRPGAVRKEASSDNNTVSPLVFRNLYSGYVVVIKSEAAQAVTINGLPEGTYGVKYTSPSEKFKDGIDFTVGGGNYANLQINQGVTTIYFKHSQTGITEEESISNKILINPNPADDFIEINMEAVSSLSPNEIRIFNMFGELMIIAKINSSFLRINVSCLPAGVYTLKVNNTIRKFIKCE